MFQFVSDAFHWKKEHQARVAVLGPLNFILIAGQLSQTMWGWITDESFAYQPSPVFDSIDEMRWALQGTANLIKQGEDPTREIDTDYLVKTIEHYAEGIGQLTGMPTPYAVQIERAIRNADLRQMVFSEYVLNSIEEAATELQNTYAREVCGKDKWGDLTEEQKKRFYVLRPDLKK